MSARFDQYVARLGDDIQRCGNITALRKREQAFDLNASERAFYMRAESKAGHSILRNGWPDFLLRDHRGRVFAVEVKGPKDRIRPAQARMFTMLEAAGVPVFIWTPLKPGRLTRWERFPSAKKPPKGLSMDDLFPVDGNATVTQLYPTRAYHNTTAYPPPVVVVTYGHTRPAVGERFPLTQCGADPACSRAAGGSASPQGPRQAAGVGHALSVSSRPASGSAPDENRLTAPARIEKPRGDAIPALRAAHSRLLSLTT